MDILGSCGWSWSHVKSVRLSFSFVLCYSTRSIAHGRQQISCVCVCVCGRWWSLAPLQRSSSSPRALLTADFWLILRYIHAHCRPAFRCARSTWWPPTCEHEMTMMEQQVKIVVNGVQYDYYAVARVWRRQLRRRSASEVVRSRRRWPADCAVLLCAPTDRRGARAHSRTGSKTPSTAAASPRPSVTAADDTFAPRWVFWRKFLKSKVLGQSYEIFFFHRSKLIRQTRARFIFFFYFYAVCTRVRYVDRFFELKIGTDIAVRGAAEGFRRREGKKINRKKNT